MEHTVIVCVYNTASTRRTATATTKAKKEARDEKKIIEIK